MILNRKFQALGSGQVNAYVLGLTVKGEMKGSMCSRYVKYTAPVAYIPQVIACFIL